MRRAILAAAICCAPITANADPSIPAIVSDHILPRFEALAETSQTLSGVAKQDCDATSPTLRAAYGDAFDAWIAASHLRFGPTEVNDRAFALAFWPDSRGATPRSLTTLIAKSDPIAHSVETYAQVSIAARGFYALEYLLFDDALMSAENHAYHCLLIQTIAADIAATSRSILDDWQARYVNVMMTPGQDLTYRSKDEVLQEMFKALTTGLQFTSDSRLGRPLGTFDRPRPTRAEARRSKRSSRHVMLNLLALQDLATHLTANNSVLSQTIDAQFQTAMARLALLDDPVFAGVAQPQSRLRIEVVQQAIQTIRTTVQADLGPKLGVTAGFNSLDGD